MAAHGAAWPSTNVTAEPHGLTPSSAIPAPEVQFRKIVDAQIAEWTERFGGAS